MLIMKFNSLSYAKIIMMKKKKKYSEKWIMKKQYRNSQILNPEHNENMNFVDTFMTHNMR